MRHIQLVLEELVVEVMLEVRVLLERLEQLILAVEAVVVLLMEVLLLQAEVAAQES
jgi:hypothetical protein